ncbi:hypothetical protein AMIS_21220 [Actinoplanes missouriensis 431]|uniref:Uncharacterized protein n=1 Tax=Actinoplanes missouriensis (strain ATCC 14538 / DSM 43046 / CBS 188.64 / JCM 3121 / NBRC 102363 / NCIMB 12654 / NRRL B-3342 / UNCC 431) TaxID=512565 RepID=I0H2V5_ACTM4|nr:hypothetical protein [Actinoplanes missouriensis]BAL87342.1 hypothetical protein AMIS_21220 [Actinoplanes missouriensis 431]
MNFDALDPGPSLRDGDTSAAEARQDHDITTAMRVLHDNGVPAWQYAEYLAARRSDELRSNGEEPF